MSVRNKQRNDPQQFSVNEQSPEKMLHGPSGSHRIASYKKLRKLKKAFSKDPPIIDPKWRRKTLKNIVQQLFSFR